MPAAGTGAARVDLPEIYGGGLTARADLRDLRGIDVKVDADRDAGPSPRLENTF
jgi:hypothetical protein